MIKDLRRDAQLILRDALKAVGPDRLFREHVRLRGDRLEICDLSINLSEIDRIIVIGTGKGTAPFARAAEEVLGDRLSAGAITVKYDHGLPLQRIEVLEAGHPIPDDATLRGTERILSLLRGLTQRDLVLVLITGGGSALLENPVSGVTLNDLQETTRALLASGAEIAQINAVRKHLSQIKGGQLLRAAQPAQVVTLIISDVIGDPPDAISSGPTSPDQTTFADAWEVVTRYHLETNLPPPVTAHLRAGYMGAIPDTPKPGDPIFDRAVLRIIGNNRLMLQAASRSAEKSGYMTIMLTDTMRGEARLMGRRLATLMKAFSAGLHSRRRICLLAGGETTVTLTDAGRGGRNQELALSAALELAGQSECLLLAAGSDGTDGPTDAAGAIVDGSTVQRGQLKGLSALEYLNRHDSYPYLEATGDLLITGPTLTNVMDLVVMLMV